MPQNGESLNKARVLGVLAGADLPLDRLAKWAASADVVLAADGAANMLEAIRIVPQTTVGDMDSISVSTKSIQTELITIHDQSLTDCDKMLATAEARGIGQITLIGVEGDLLDHVLGNIFSSARSTLGIRFALRRGIAHILRGPVEGGFQLPDQTRVSLMPITECTGVSLEEVEWPLSDATLSPTGSLSISNRGKEKLHVRLQAGVAVLFLLHPSLESPNWD